VKTQALAAAAGALALTWTAPAVAGGQTQQLTVNGGALVRGAAPLPDFHLDFLLEDPARQVLLPLGRSSDLEIALTSPDNDVFRFLFSPRPQLGLSVDKLTGGNRGYAGLTWNLFDSRTVFGNLGVAGTYDAAAGAPNDPLRRPLGPPLMLHGALELGYHLGDQHSLSLRLDEGRVPEFRLNGESSDNLSLRYGLRF
jgi:lipid A 3-O-deacylase